MDEAKEKETETRQRIQWQPLVELIVVLMTILGSTIPLYIHTDNKLADAMSKIDCTLQSIKDDMRDFHGRICAIEERNKK
jgi:hypothetical protein